jgi:hypothetical protein
VLFLAHELTVSHGAMTAQAADAPIKERVIHPPDDPPDIEVAGKK